ncbi:triple QxxK/R motif-containing protein-like [Ylistrum balloti]|uniref:triple QxxK/R motif-containing protein-like n=1 Tax=Ylistrum balloti TaxID=509963 RepID=UPI002905C44F|nr:triple QxxK/R motif-containing protein-like [Ylistrum balloti]XP_060073260.1 triple QxxK/R motif-containing protein-like [Ylistrum balloti]
MGKKDTQANRGAPVDMYRKQIGKQDYKKSKSEVKKSKDRAGKLQSALGIKDVVLMLTGFLLVIVAVYMILYVSLDRTS